VASESWTDRLLVLIGLLSVGAGFGGHRVWAMLPELPSPTLDPRLATSAAVSTVLSCACACATGAALVRLGRTRLGVMFILLGLAPVALTILS
jgi:hypothetical protein